LASKEIKVRNEDFTGTGEVQEKNRFDTASLEAYMLGNVEGFSGPLIVEQFKGGQSNPTFLLSAGGKKYVLRRKPPGKLLPSAHAVDREYRVITALRNSHVPVARTYCLCQDDSVIGTWFYIMDYVAGNIAWDPSFPGMENSRRREIYRDMNRVISRLHKVDYIDAGLADFGRTGNYMERQIGRWIKQYRAAETERMEDMEQLIDWLPQNVPPGEETSIVHGDYRLDNIILHSDKPLIAAILDWELSTLGHPLADFAYHCMNWHVPYSEYKGLGGLDLRALGIPTEGDYVAEYCRNSGREIVPPAEWDFYMAYSFFRIAAMSQGIKARALDGSASNRRAVEYGARTPRYAQLGRMQMEKAKTRHN
jgi:aminoglycoside phosphotransferase (APT) family kinase protein